VNFNAVTINRETKEKGCHKNKNKKATKTVKTDRKRKRRERSGRNEKMAKEGAPGKFNGERKST